MALHLLLYVCIVVKLSSLKSRVQKFELILSQVYLKKDSRDNSPLKTDIELICYSNHKLHTHSVQVFFGPKGLHFRAYLKWMTPSKMEFTNPSW